MSLSAAQIKLNADLNRNYIQAMHKGPMCRFCYRGGPLANLRRISESPFRDAIAEMFPMSIYGVKETQLPDWYCGVCQKALYSSNSLQASVVISQPRLNPMLRRVPVEPVGVASSSSSSSRPRAVDMAKVVRNPVGKKVPKPLLNSSSCGLNLALDDSDEDLAKMLDEKRVPDIPTNSPPKEMQRSKPKSVSVEDLPMPLPDPSNPCRQCRLLFVSDQQVSWHTRVHTNRGTLRCRFCPKELPKMSSYIKHVTRKHVGIRRTQCDLCGEDFGGPGNCRTIHDLRHKGTRMKYACSFCPLIFNRYKKLRQHRQQVHNGWRQMCRNNTDE